MKEIIYNMNMDFEGLRYIENSPKYSVSIRIIKFRNDYKDYRTYIISSKLDKFIKEFNNGDIITIEYPIFWNRRTGASLYNSKLCITNERLGKSEEIDATRLCGFWEFVEEFSIIIEED